jgi:hypothetical protein
MSRLKNSLGVLVLLGALTAGLLAFPAAVFAQAVTRAYTSDQTLQRGMVVRITEDSHQVQALTMENSTEMEGVVVAANDSPVTLSDQDPKKQQVFVANTGHYHVLVSNQNGPVKNNDYLTISSIAGIAMKADSKQAIVVGKALASFDGKTNISGTATLKDNKGASIATAIGLIPVDINISHNPLEAGITSQIPALGFLQAGARVIVNKPVDPGRVYVCLVVLLIVMGISGSILYSGIRNGFIAIGRNPLAKKSITRGFAQVVITSIIISIIGLVAVYLILKL